MTDEERRSNGWALHSSFCEAGCRFVRRTGGSEEFAYTPVEEEKNGRDSAKIAFPMFPFSLPILCVVPSDQSVFITIARDLRSFGFLLLCYERKGILSHALSSNALVI